MSDVNKLPLEERVLLLAPTAADAALSRSLLADAGMACHVCADLCCLCRAYEEGAGAVLLTEEVLGAGDSECLVDLLHRQPAWSDVPILLLTSQGADSPMAVEAMERLGNVTLLERPVRLNTLVSAMRTALRARRRQYELRSRLEKSRANEEDLRKRQEVLRLVHQIGKVGHWEWNALTDENKWSPEIQALYGLEPGTFEGTYEAWARLVHPDDLPRAKADVRRALETGKYCTEFRVVWPDGSVHWIEARASVFKDGHGKPIRIMGVNMDITERKCQEEALREADRKKNEFLATLAHELRNPLAPIRNAVQFLNMRGSAEPELQNARDIIDRQVRHMTHLVDDLLDVARISRGKINLQKEKASLALVLTNAVEAARPLIEAQAHELTVTLPPQAVYLEADTTRLEQVFLNLLNNAAKYTEPGGRIWLAADRQGSDVVVSVRDNGVGIPADKLPTLFEMFSQVEGSLSRSQGGLGIGLHLVKRLVEMHGGSVTAHSRGPGQGSEFVVRLPAFVETSKPSTPTERGEPTVPKSSLRILIVDDNREGADSLGMVLRLMATDTRTAYDGEAAVAAAGEFRPDVVLLDIGLPKLNGYEAARRIRGQPWGKEMVLIAVSGWGRDEDRRRSREAGFDKHLVKPVDPHELMKLLAEFTGVKPL